MPCDEIYAKSEGNGKTLLTDHLKQVSSVIVAAAKQLCINTDIANKAALLHDIGKAHPKFQEKLFQQKRHNFGLPYRHEISSLMFLPLFNKEEWNPLIEMIIAHHRSIRMDSKGQGILDLAEIVEPEELFEWHYEPWTEWGQAALDILANLGIATKTFTKTQSYEAFIYAIDYCEKLPLGWSKWKGLLVGSDHFASALDTKTEDYIKELFIAPDLSPFANRENSVYPLSLLKCDNNFRHTLVIAPTGAGKTDYLMRRCKGRVFYTLPFQASINAMFKRFTYMMPGQKGIRLLHASSKVFESDKNFEENVLQDKFGASIKILTPHQLASLICGTRGFEAIAIDIAGCDVILDEIHTYSNIAQSMVIEIIKALLKLNCNIHVGSATMPTALQTEILSVMGINETAIVRLNEETLNTFDRHIVFKLPTYTDAEEHIKNAVKDSNKILIVCNRVAVAQERFEKIGTLFPNYKKLLLHSRFKRADRSNIETMLTEEFNTSAEGCIVVSTQVVEVSLDINFDIMITDCAPLDSMIQRFGRINRKRTNESITYKRIKPVYVIAPPDNLNDCKPYDMDILQNSFEQLQDNQILKKNTLQKKIDAVYPELKQAPINTHLVWNGNDFLLTELCHYSKSVLMEMLNVESAAAICFSDKEKYENSKQEERLKLEIPVSRNIRYYKITNFGFSKYGSNPIIVPDELYNQETGLQLKETDQFI